MARGSSAVMAEAAASSREKAVEEAVNRWALLFYSQRAVQAFRAGSSRDFRQFRDVIYAVLARPLALEQRIILQLRIIQLLSRIEEDWTINIRTELTPLECALHLLEKMRSEFDVDVNIFEEIQKNVKEAAVIACIKNKEYNQAKKILKKYMSKDPSTLKMRILLQNIIREKNPSDPAILDFSFKRFQQTVLMLLENYMDDSEPFLSTMAEKYSSELVEPQMNPKGATSEEMEVSEPVKKSEEEEVTPTATGPGSQLQERPQEASMKDSLEFEMQELPEEEGPEKLEGDRQASVKVLPTVGGSRKEATLRCLGDIRERRAASEPHGKSSRDGAEPARVSDRRPLERPTSYGHSVILSDHDAAFQKLDETDWFCPKVTQRPARNRGKRQREEMEEEEEEEKGLKDATSGPQTCSEAGNYPVTISTFVMGKVNTISKDAADKCMVPKKLLVTMALQAEKEQQKEPPKAHSSPKRPLERPTTYGHSVILSDSDDPDAAFQKLDETDWTCPKVTQRPARNTGKRQREEMEEEDKEEAEEEEKGLKDATSGPQSCSEAGNKPVTISTFLMEKENTILKDAADKRMVPKKLLVTVALQAAEEQQKEPPKAHSSPKSSKASISTSTEEEEKEVWSDEEELFIDLGPKGRKNNSSNTSINGCKRKKWTREESQWIKAGVRKFGEGNWKAIFKSYPFKERTPVMIKDRWRTMKKLGIQ
nr:telomeric repeat-binding factor 2 isoform X1 [Anolis sagrei ordinatus]